MNENVFNGLPIPIFPETHNESAAYVMFIIFVILTVINSIAVEGLVMRSGGRRSRVATSHPCEFRGLKRAHRHIFSPIYTATRLHGYPV